MFHSILIFLLELQKYQIIVTILGAVFLWNIITLMGWNSGYHWSRHSFSFNRKSCNPYFKWNKLFKTSNFILRWRLRPSIVNDVAVLWYGYRRLGVVFVNLLPINSIVWNHPVSVFWVFPCNNSTVIRSN